MPFPIGQQDRMNALWAAALLNQIFGSDAEDAGNLLPSLRLGEAPAIDPVVDLLGAKIAVASFLLPLEENARQVGLRHPAAMQQDREIAPEVLPNVVSGVVYHASKIVP